MLVMGVDQSRDQIQAAEQSRGSIPAERLTYVVHDLRQPLGVSGFDAALNVFTSLGYGSEEEDLAILRTLRDAVRPGGAALVETIHRDAWAALLSREGAIASRLADGTVMIQEAKFDAVTGRADIAYFWQGPHGGGEKRASVRIYSVTELVRLLDRAGLHLRSAIQTATGTPFEAKGPSMGGRVALVCDPK